MISRALPAVDTDIGRLNAIEAQVGTIAVANGRCRACPDEANVQTFKVEDILVRDSKKPARAMQARSDSAREVSPALEGRQSVPASQARMRPAIRSVGVRARPGAKIPPLPADWSHEEGGRDGSSNTAQAAGVAVFISAMLACTIFMAPCRAAKAASHSISARSHLLGCWDKIISPEEKKPAPDPNPGTFTMQPSSQVCFLKGGDGGTWVVNTNEREINSSEFRWRLAGQSRLVINFDYIKNDIKCGLILEDGRTMTLNGCYLSGKFTKTMRQ
jgi:hypothetical protein